MAGDYVRERRGSRRILREQPTPSAPVLLTVDQDCTLVRRAVCRAAVPLQVHSNRLPKRKSSGSTSQIYARSPYCNGTVNKKVAACGLLQPVDFCVRKIPQQDPANKTSKNPVR